MSLADDILRLRWRGNSTRAIATVLGLDVMDVRKMNREVDVHVRSVNAIDRTPLGPVAEELVERMRLLEDGRCRYIELDVADVAASPCGRPCCKVKTRGYKRRSSWCEEHHLVVYPETEDGAWRVIT